MPPTRRSPSSSPPARSTWPTSPASSSSPAASPDRELARPVNDRDYDVALHVVFDGRPSHDAYQTTPPHLRFIEENKENWAKVRVFDSTVEGKG